METDQLYRRIARSIERQNELKSLTLDTFKGIKTGYGTLAQRVNITISYGGRVTRPTKLIILSKLTGRDISTTYDLTVGEALALIQLSKRSSFITELKGELQ